MSSISTANFSCRELQEAGIFDWPSIPTDETLYSLCARISHNALTSAAAMSNQLLGYPNGPRHTAMVYGLDRLEAMLVSNHSSWVIDEFTIRTRTVLGGVLPLLPAKYRAQVVRTVRAPHPLSAMHRMLSLRDALHGVCTTLRRCPDCASKDLSLLGFTYWHTVHQLPGIWVCPWHGRPLQWMRTISPKQQAWLVAHRQDGDFDELNVSPEELDLLHRLAAAVVWIACQWSLGPATLPIMVRARLHWVGFLAAENMVTEIEQRRIHRFVAAPLAHAFPQLFSVFRTAEWVGKTLSLAEFGHPLRWAVLIASTLASEDQLRPHDVELDGEPISRSQALSRAFRCKAPEVLDADHIAAQQRAAQMGLFPDRRGPRRERAPERLYDALGKGLRIAKASQCAGLTSAQIRGWVRNDRALAEHWHDSIARLRTEQACQRLEQYLNTNPCALRSQVLHKEVASVRALERYAPKLLDDLIPAVQPKYSHQKRLAF